MEPQALTVHQESMEHQVSRVPRDLRVILDATARSVSQALLEAKVMLESTESMVPQEPRFASNEPCSHIIS